MEMPTDLLHNFQQASALDRLQHHATVLGSAAETVHGGYTRMFDELQRVIGAVDNSCSGNTRPPKP